MVRETTPLTGADLDRWAMSAGSSEEAAVAAGLEAFESEWAEVSRTLETEGRGNGDRRWRHSRVAIRAVAETAEGRIGPLLEGARVDVPAELG